MGYAWYVTPESDLPDITASSVNGKALAHQAEAMDALAVGLGLTPLSDFLSVSSDEWESLTGEELPDDVKESMPPEAWFAPADGLATVRGMLAALEQDPEASETYAQVIEDLRDVESVLVVAEAHVVRFHLTPDF